MDESSLSRATTINPARPKQLERSMTTTGIRREKSTKVDRLLQDYLKNDVDSIQKSFSDHAEYTLARTKFNLDSLAAYQAAAYSVRDRLIEKWNDTQQFFTETDPKRVYYLSLEFLMGRSLQNAVHNMAIEQNYEKALLDLGFVMEELYEMERDAALGNGGLGRLAACFMDSLSTCNIPAWGYGIRYNYGMFEQGLRDGFQTETPDYWLSGGNPWEIPRLDIHYPVHFYGEVHSWVENGVTKYKWEGGETVEAVAYDMPIPGYQTLNTNNIRLWSSSPSKEFDLSSFNKGNYYMAVEAKQRAENITSVLYPDDSTHEGKELRLKQQYFFCAATLSDITRRFLKIHESWDEFPDKVAIQLNDTHPTISIVELMRLLIDEHDLEWDNAWQITVNTFAYTNHTILPEALEKWPVSMFQHLFPRHLQIIERINHHFMEFVAEKFNHDTHIMRELSIFEEGSVKKIRMANLAIVGSHTTNGVAALHTDLLKQFVFPTFHKLYPDKFQNKTNGVTPRRWIEQANPALTEILHKHLGTKEWVHDLNLVEKLKAKADNPELHEEWENMRMLNKSRLIEYIEDLTGIRLKMNMLFDIQIKRIHEYKRQLMNILYVIHRYLILKDMTPAEREKVVPRAVIFAGKAAPAYHTAKRIIKLIASVSAVLNADPETRNYLMAVFLPNYNVSMAQVLIPASDMNEQISTAGMEASGTGNMKFMMNGSLIIGTMDGANVEICAKLGEENMFIFGLRTEEVEAARAIASSGKAVIDDRLQRVFSVIRSGRFGDPNLYESVLHNLEHTDYFLVVPDFPLYVEAQERVDEMYKDRKKWTRRSILSTASSAFFSSDRTIRQYAAEIWNAKEVKMTAKETREKNKQTS